MLRKIFMRNDLSKERFRNEWKYLISTSEKRTAGAEDEAFAEKGSKCKGKWLYDPQPLF